MSQENQTEVAELTYVDSLKVGQLVRFESTKWDSLSGTFKGSGTTPGTLSVELLSGFVSSVEESDIDAVYLIRRQQSNVLKYFVGGILVDVFIIALATRAAEKSIEDAWSRSR